MPKRLRAHTNPLGHALFETPISPDKVDWSEHYPKYFAAPAAGAAAAAAAGAGAADSKAVVNAKEVTFADIGCGFGGLLVALSTHFPNNLSLGLEIRDAVVDLVRARIDKLRAEHAPKPAAGAAAAAAASDAGAGAPGPYDNISVVRSNIMKYAPNYFRKGQLQKMFILFGDPHFKKTNHRRRVINSNFLSMYAYCLAPGGLLYTISDVKELAEWQIHHCSEHPLFERVSDAELESDVCLRLIADATEEGQKVTRLNGQKYPGVFRRLAHPKPPTTYVPGSGTAKPMTPYTGAQTLAAAGTGTHAAPIPVAGAAAAGQAGSEYAANSLPKPAAKAGAAAAAAAK